jgi:cytochrome P450
MYWTDAPPGSTLDALDPGESEGMHDGMTEHPNVIAAVGSPCPRTVYQGLVRRESLWWDARLDAWIAAGAGLVREVMEHPALRVRPLSAPAPTALAGKAAGDIFAAFARMNDGERHRRLKAAVMAAVEPMTPDQVVRATREALALRDPIPTLHELQFQVPVRIVGTFLGVPCERLDDVVAWTSAFVRAAAPGASGADVAAGISAAPHLIGLLENDALFACVDDEHLSHEERVANAIGLLFQTYDATAGLIGNTVVTLMQSDLGTDFDALLRDVAHHDAPVQNTRRFAASDVVIGGTNVREGDTIIVVLASANLDDPAPSWSFGHGPHRYPGEGIALAIAREVVAFALRKGLVPKDGDGPIAYHPSVNARIPDFKHMAGQEAQA